MPEFCGLRVPDFFVRYSAQPTTLGATTKTITAASNATPIVITSNAHGYSNGNYLFITAVGGNTAANGIRIVANKTANTYELTDMAGNNVAGNGAYTAGGTSQLFAASPVVASVDFYMTKARFAETPGTGLTVNLMDGDAPATFKYDAVNIAANSVALEIDPSTSTPLYCKNGLAVWASAAGLQTVIEGYRQGTGGA